jgi:hypothetical protein
MTKTSQRLALPRFTRIERSFAWHDTVNYDNAGHFTIVVDAPASGWYSRYNVLRTFARTHRTEWIGVELPLDDALRFAMDPHPKTFAAYKKIFLARKAESR